MYVLSAHQAPKTAIQTAIVISMTPTPRSFKHSVRCQGDPYHNFGTEKYRVGVVNEPDKAICEQQNTSSE
jgi:hypothetical protein